MAEGQDFLSELKSALKKFHTGETPQESEDEIDNAAKSAKDSGISSQHGHSKRYAGGSHDNMPQDASSNHGSLQEDKGGLPQHSHTLPGTSNRSNQSLPESLPGNQQLTSTVDRGRGRTRLLRTRWEPIDSTAVNWAQNAPKIGNFQRTISTPVIGGRGQGSRSDLKIWQQPGQGHPVGKLQNQDKPRTDSESSRDGGSSQGEAGSLHSDLHSDASVPVRHGTAVQRSKSLRTGAKKDLYQELNTVLQKRVADGHPVRVLDIEKLKTGKSIMYFGRGNKPVSDTVTTVQTSTAQRHTQDTSHGNLPSGGKLPQSHSGHSSGSQVAMATNTNNDLDHNQRAGLFEDMQPAESLEFQPLPVMSWTPQSTDNSRTDTPLHQWEPRTPNPDYNNKNSSNSSLADSNDGGPGNLGDRKDSSTSIWPIVSCLEAKLSSSAIKSNSDDCVVDKKQNLQNKETASLHKTSVLEKPSNGSPQLSVTETKPCDTPRGGPPPPPPPLPPMSVFKGIPEDSKISEDPAADFSTRIQTLAKLLQSRNAVIQNSSSSSSISPTSSSEDASRRQHSMEPNDESAVLDTTHPSSSPDSHSSGSGSHPGNPNPGLSQVTLDYSQPLYVHTDLNPMAKDRMLPGATSGMLIERESATVTKMQATRAKKDSGGSRTPSSPTPPPRRNKAQRVQSVVLQNSFPRRLPRTDLGEGDDTSAESAQTSSSPGNRTKRGVRRSVSQRSEGYVSTCSSGSSQVSRPGHPGILVSQLVATARQHASLPTPSTVTSDVTLLGKDLSPGFSMGTPDLSYYTTDASTSGCNLDTSVTGSQYGDILRARSKSLDPMLKSGVGVSGQPRVCSAPTPSPRQQSSEMEDGFATYPPPSTSRTRSGSDDIITSLMITHSGDRIPPDGAESDPDQGNNRTNRLSSNVTVPEPTSFHCHGNNVGRHFLERKKSSKLQRSEMNMKTKHKPMGKPGEIAVAVECDGLPIDYSKFEYPYSSPYSSSLGRTSSVSQGPRQRRGGPTLDKEAQRYLLYYTWTSSNQAKDKKRHKPRSHRLRRISREATTEDSDSSGADNLDTSLYGGSNPSDGPLSPATIKHAGKVQRKNTNSVAKDGKRVIANMNGKQPSSPAVNSIDVPSTYYITNHMYPHNNNNNPKYTDTLENGTEADTESLYQEYTDSLIRYMRTDEVSRTSENIKSRYKQQLDAQTYEAIRKSQHCSILDRLRCCFLCQSQRSSLCGVSTSSIRSRPSISMRFMNGNGI